MTYLFWSLVNLIFIALVFLAIIIYEPARSTIFELAKVSAITAIILFSINLSMYFIFRTIKKAKTKSIKIFFVKLSRRVFKLHIYLAITGTSLIIVHAILMIFNILASGAILVNLNIILGVLAFTFLLSTLTTGYIRYQRATGRRRRNHLISAFSFLALFLLHIIF